MRLFNRKEKITTTRPNRTPSSTKSLYSYHNNRSVRDEKSSRMPEEIIDKKNAQKKKRIIQHIPTLIMVIVIVLCMFYLSTVDTNVQININGDKKTVLRDPAVYQNEATKFVNNSVVNRSKLLFDNQGLTEHLKYKFPEISAITITLPIIGRKPMASIQTTKPSFILASGQDSFLIGTNGVALLNVRDGQNIVGLGLRTVNDESGVTIEPGKSALPQEQALFISIVVEQLEKQGFRVDSLTIPSSPYDLNVKIVDSSYIVKFNILEDPKQQVGSFIALSKKLESDRLTPKEYIDVRVGERVFYR